MIEVLNIQKSYKNKKSEASFCVENINLKAEKGKIIGILGPNGSGKSTILKSICGFHYVDEGKINITQEDSLLELSNNFIPENLMNVIGYVPEISILPSEMTVETFIKYISHIHNNICEEQISKIIKICNIESVLSKKIKTLSKGFQQRVSLFQALIHSPENLILDEIITGLDPNQIIEIRDLIKNLSQEKSIIMSTHILQEVNSLCDYIYIINNGKIVCEGTEKDILSNSDSKNLEEAFVKLTKEGRNE